MFCSGLRSLAIPPLYLLYLPPLSDCAGSAVVKMDAQFIAARERLLRPQRGPTARYLLWPGWLNDVRCWARAQHLVARGVCERLAVGDRKLFVTGCGCRLRASCSGDPCNELHFTYWRNCPELGILRDPYWTTSPSVRGDFVKHEAPARRA